MSIITHSHFQSHVWTNIFYFISGFFLLILHGAWMPFIGLTALAIASWLGHYYGGWWWDVDWAGMYVAFLSLFAHLVEPWLFIFAPLVIYLTLTNNRSLTWLIGACWLLTIIASFIFSPSIVNSIIAVGIFLLAYGCKLHPRYATKGHWNFLHSMWHFFTALGFYFIIA
jgi:hypothetical protein